MRKISKEGYLIGFVRFPYLIFTGFIEINELYKAKKTYEKRDSLYLILAMKETMLSFNKA
jgi:hypothetical protein